MRRFAANLLILSALYVMFFWSLPDSAFRTHMVNPTLATVNYLGLQQWWNLFAPSPGKMNTQLEGRIWTRDGRKMTWTPPLSEELGFMGSLRQEQYHKYSEYLRGDSFSAFWPDFAKYLARETALRNGLTPGSHTLLKVELIRRWSTIPDPLELDYQPIPPHYEPTEEFKEFESEVAL